MRPPPNPQVHGDPEYLGRLDIQAINQDLDEEGVDARLDSELANMICQMFRGDTCISEEKVKVKM